MSLPTSRTSDYAEVLIDYQLCAVCGICVDVCKGGPLYLENNQLKVDQSIGFGCIACAACVAVCPTDAIRISGRDLFPEDISRVPPLPARADYASLYSLLSSRRSTRKFKQQEIKPEIVEKILNSAATAPVGIPPTDVGVLVFRTPAAVSALQEDLLDSIKYWPKIFSKPIINLLRPFIGRENADMFGNFIAPAVKTFLDKKAEGEDWLLYNAPLLLFFYGTPYNDPGDTIIATTLAMLAGESMGLGTCILGFPGYIFQYSKKARMKYGLPKKMQPGLAVIFGYPKYQVHNTLKRRFREVRIFE
jgi:ferredoxin